MSEDRKSPGSISRLIPKVKEGDDAAYNELVARILSRVVKIAGRIYARKYPGVSRGDADEEDAAQDALLSLWKGAQRGMFEQLANRNDLWNLLATITARKIAKRYRAGVTKKRGGRDIDHRSEADAASMVDQIPAPEFAAIMKDTYDAALSSLTKEQAVVARDWAEDLPRFETAQKLQVSVATVSRMRGEIEETLLKKFPMEE